MTFPIEPTGDTIDSERSLLGGLLLGNQSYDLIAVLDNIGFKAEHFSRHSHTNAYREIRALAAKMGQIKPGAGTAPKAGPDTLTICQWLSSRGTADACGGLSEVATFADRAAGPSSGAYIARGLMEAHARRQVLHHARQLADDITNGRESVEETILRHTTALSDVAVDDNCENVHTGQDLADAFWRSQNCPEENEVIPTGIEPLDARLEGGGLVVERLYYVPARPGHGKTVMMQKLCEGAALNGARAHIIEIEMSATREGSDGHARAGDFTTRIMTSLSGVPAGAIKAYRKGHHQWTYPDTSIYAGQVRTRREDEPKLKRASITLSEIPLTVDDSPSLTYAALFSKIRRMKAKHADLKVVGIDYIGLVKGERGEDEAAILKATSNGLKALAKALGIAIICLSQLNRQCEDLKDKRPRAHHFRGSGELEHDADHTLFMQRPCKYDEWNTKDNQDVVWIADRKGRHGGIWEVCITMDPEHMILEGPERRDPVKDGGTTSTANCDW